MENPKQPETTNRLYWIVVNIRKRLGGVVGRFAKKRPVLFILTILLVLAVLFINRSSVQPVVLAIRKFLLLAIAVFLVLRWYFKNWENRSNRGNVIATIVMLAVGAFSYFLGPGIYRYISLYVHYSQMQKVELTQLPETGHERIQPINSVMTLINQEALDETDDATPPKFVRGNDGKYYFSSAFGPGKDYKIQQLKKDMFEVLHVPANLPAPVFSSKYRDNVQFDIGEILLFSKKTHTAVTKRFNFMQYINCEAGEPFYIQSRNGEWKQIVPILKWKGILLPRPVFGGVFIIDEKRKEDVYWKRVLLGRGGYVSPQRIEEFSYLKGQNLIPKRVARFIAESFRFTNGFLAPMPGYHEGDIRIPSLPNDINPQPFITYFDVDNAGKLYNFFGLEPYEETKKGLSLSLLIPGDDDTKVYFIDHRNQRNALIGSSAVAAKIIESKKNYDWSKNYPAESRPFVRNVDGTARFMWLSTIVTKAGDQGEYIGGSIPEITLTDATHGKVVWIDSDSLINNASWIRQAERNLGEYWRAE